MPKKPTLCVECKKPVTPPVEVLEFSTGRVWCSPACVAVKAERDEKAAQEAEAKKGFRYL